MTNFNTRANPDFILNIIPNDLFLHPTHFCSSLLGPTSALFLVTEVCELSGRFGFTDRIVRGHKYVPDKGEYGQLRFLEECSLWAGSLKTKVPNTIDVNFVGKE